MASPRFQVVRVRPHGYVYARALDDVAAYLDHALRALGHAVEVADNVVDPGARVIVVGAHLLSAEALARLPLDAVLFNSEPLADVTSWQLSGGTYAAALARHVVWDYSHANVRHVPHARVRVIPLWFLRGLERAHLPRTRGDRLVFYGGLTPRRRAILDELARRGVGVDVLTGCYGKERDARIRQSLGVLNLKRHDALVPFEAVRCVVPLVNGVPVITEDAPLDPTLDPLRRCVTVAADVAAIAGAVEDVDAFRTTAATQTAEFRALDPLPAIAEAISYTSSSGRR